jgi:hypothetical protein
MEPRGRWTEKVWEPLIYRENPMPEYSTFARVKENTKHSVIFFCLGLLVKE